MKGNALVWLLAAGCGIGVANIYYNQPLLAQMSATFSAGTGFLPTYTQVGAGLGMFLFVPLGDMRERRWLICAVSLAEAVACIFTAIAPSLPFLATASFLVGIMGVTPHLILPFAAQIAAPEKRGRVLGTVLSGLLIGILLARTLSGFLGAAFGWRAVYWFAAALMLTMAAVFRWALPQSLPLERLTYGELLRSMVSLIRTKPLLRSASVIGGLLFGSFSAFWATLVFVLSTPPYHYGSRMAGTFGLIGLAGALAASHRRASHRPSRAAIHGCGRHCADGIFLGDVLHLRRLALGLGNGRDDSRSRRANGPRCEPDAHLCDRPSRAQPLEHRLHGHVLRGWRIGLRTERGGMVALRMDGRLCRGPCSQFGGGAGPIH